MHSLKSPPLASCRAALLESLGVRLNEHQLASALEQLLGPRDEADGQELISFGRFLLFFKG